MNIHDVYRRISPRFRAKRMAQFLSRFQPGDQTTVLDLGGAPSFWMDAAVRFPVVVVNLDVPEDVQRYAPQFTILRGDATHLAFPDASFDIAYSNSVIEHLGTWENQQRFAQEARRVGKRLWIQTPARWFPVEPHLLAPFVHYLPKRFQRALVRWFTVWGWVSRPSRQQIASLLDEIRLLTLPEMRRLFPDCEILRERLFGLTKSYIAVRS